MVETNGGGRGRGYVARAPEQKVMGYQMKFRFVVLHNMHMKFGKKCLAAEKLTRKTYLKCIKIDKQIKDSSAIQEERKAN